VDNPYNEKRVSLGHMLFFDPILSGPMDVACSTCHLPGFAFGDGRQFASGAGGTGLGPERTDPQPPPLRLMPRNSPTVFNTGVYGRKSPAPTVNSMMFWSGGAFGLEGQVLNPIAADKELRGLTYPKVHAIDSVIHRLRDIPEYVDLFAGAYPEIVAAHGMDPTRLITSTTLRRALAAYIRELLTPDAPLDRYLRGDEGALSDAQEAGLELFIGKAGCTACHRGPAGSDFSQYVIGARQAGLGRDTTPGDDVGWGELGGTPYAFRTAPLRQVELTAPYLHAGTAATLREVVEFKNRGESDHPKVTSNQLDPLVRPLGLTTEEVSRLVQFLAAYTDRITTEGPLFQAPERVPSGLEIPK
jgi:cytochrome c peroxidase